MTLTYRITSRISFALLILVSVWASLFYFIIEDEINDETDDSLEAYSEYIIARALAGESLPSVDNGTNNSYHITDVTAEYAEKYPSIRYYDEMIYVYSKRETEPARILKTIFRDSSNRYYELIVSIPTIEKHDLQETILHWIVFLYLGLLVAIIGINWWILYRSFRPLYALLKWLDAFSVEKEIPVLDNSTNISEFSRLNEAVEQSARRNIEVYLQQKTFISNASHELQTPLAVCRNRLEMLLEDPQLSEQQLGELLKTRQSIDHIIKLNKTLLMLTKIENNQYPDKQNVNINELIRKLIKDYSEVYNVKNIQVKLYENAEIHLLMNETLASILFGNLLKNAFLHNEHAGFINIYIRSTSVSIENSGLLRALPPDAVFERFYQGTKKEGSTGLGLAICKSICNLYSLDIRYDFLQQKHSFILSF